ncbi:MAG TPA: hypothetical protein VNF75_03805 [Candidatus Dormibacteraeota bacterium]|nr:hypothetical protein [Candidatus Dormibacteraeota bacterium]
MNELVQAAVSLVPHVPTALTSLSSLAPTVAATACSAAAAGGCIGSLISQVQPWVAAGIPLVAGYTLFQRYPKVESHAMLIGETAIGIFAFEALWSVMAPILATHLA